MRTPLQAYLKNQSFVTRLLNLVWPSAAKAESNVLLTEAEFWKLIQKERLRMLRRGIGFSVVSISSDESISRRLFQQYVDRVRRRVRQTDELGVLNGKLSVLLADTDIDGGRLVSNHLMQEARDLGFEVDSEVFFPDDFPASGSDAFQPNTNFRPDHHDTESEDVLRSRADSYQLDEPTSSVESDALAFSARPNSVSSGSATALKESPQVQTVGQFDTKKSFLHLRFQARPKLQEEVESESIAATPLPSPPSLNTPLWKRVMDVSGATIGLVGLSPLLLAVGVAICFESKGGAFFTQLREGKDGKKFHILKFRTMGVNAESQKAELRQHSEQDGPAFKMTNDPRVTRIGKILRKTCIDELPQLWNVLKGDMSLVGPRPLPVDESQACCQWQRRRLDVLPGLTCLWQVQDQREIPFSDWMRLDLSYVRNRSFFGDWKLVFKTIWVALRVKGSV